MFEGEDIVVELDGFFRFDKGSPAGVAFSVEDAFYLAFVFGEDRHYPSAIQERLFDIGDITGFAQFGKDAIENAP